MFGVDVAFTLVRVEGQTDRDNIQRSQIIHHLNAAETKLRPAEEPMFGLEILLRSNSGTPWHSR
jgi:hypothetical protein